MLLETEPAAVRKTERIGPRKAVGKISSKDAEAVPVPVCSATEDIYLKLWG